MAVVNTNIGASLAQAALVKNQRSLDTAMEQLSTGSKINSAADDAAGLHNQHAFDVSDHGSEHGC